MKINAAIQLLPLDAGKNKYELIDAAILLIQSSGLIYKVCPFETVVEGDADKVYTLIRAIQDSTLKNGCNELLINVKIHAANKNLTIQDKLEKY